MRTPLDTLHIAGLLALLLMTGSAFGTAAAQAPTPEELANATYGGLETPPGPVTLLDGRWEGEPFIAGGASRPAVHLVPGFVLTGDIDGDGREEAVVLLGERAGGSGEFIHLAVVARVDGRPRNTGTVLIGDRVQLRDARIEAGRIVLDLVQAGPTDAVCCPGDLATRAWALSAAGLAEVEAAGVTGRLSLDAVAGTEWVLRAWNVDEPAPADPQLTLAYRDGQFAGYAGCNRYFAQVQAGKMPGDVSVGPTGATRRACREPQMSIEGRFLRQLGGVVKFGFVAGRLALSYRGDTGPGMMLFERRTPQPAR